MAGGAGAAGQAPVAALTPTCSGLVCTFSGAASTDADGAIQDHSWAFGDGDTTGTASVPTTSHTYATAGTYPVTLTVTDDRGATGTAVTAVAASVIFGEAFTWPIAAGIALIIAGVLFVEFGSRANPAEVSS